MKKHVAFITALALSVALLASCARESASTGGTSGSASGASATARPEFTYVPQYVELPSEVTQMTKPLMLDGIMYFVADVTHGTETVTLPEGGGSYDVDITEQRLYAMNADGSGYRELADFTHGEIPETAEAGANWSVEKMIAANDGSLWLYESGNFGYSDENGVYFDDTRAVLRRVSTTDGAELAAIDLTTAEAVAEEETGGALPEGAGARPGGSGSQGGGMATMPAGAGAMMSSLRSMGVSIGFGNAYLRADAQGNLYVGDGMGSVRVFGADGTEKSAVELAQNVMMQDLVNLPNGDVAVIYRDMSGVHIVAIDADAAALGEEFCVYSGNYSGITYAGIADDGASLLFYSSTGLYSIGADGKETELVNWLASDVDANGIYVLGSPDGESILCMTGIQNDSFTTSMGRGNAMTISVSFAGFDGGAAVPLELLRLVKTPTADLPERTELTLAAISLDQNLRAEVLRFNKRSQEYRIRVVDYSELGIDKLNTDIIMGNVPDIILADGLPISTYIERGILEDLFPYLDADTALGGRDAIMPAFLNALTTGEALYRISSGFTINTLAGNADLLGAGDGWTMDELNAVVAANPDSFLLPENFDRSTVLYRILSNNLDEYIDPVTGECKFNTPEFIKLMELLRDNFSEATAPETNANAGFGGGASMAAPAVRIRMNEAVELMSGKQLLQSTTLRGFDSLMQSNVQANGNPVFKGYPSAERNGNTFDTTLTLAMSVNCADKAGAWEFMRGILTPAYQTANGGRGGIMGGGSGFPSNYSVFLEQAAEAMTEDTEQETTMALASNVGLLTSDGSKDLDGDGVADIYPKGMLMGGEMTFIYYYAMTEAEFDRYMDFFNSITRVAEGSEKVVEIVSEELEAFFAGQKTAEATATVIQSRVRLFTDEQR